MEHFVKHCDNYDINCIRTDKFKNCSIDIVLNNLCDIEKITDYNLLSSILSYSCKNYPTKKDFAIKMEELYCTSVVIYNTRVGNRFLTNFSIDFLNPKYCYDGFLDDCIDLLFNVIFNPYVDNDGFNSDVFNLVKSRMEFDILTENENPVSKALKNSYNLLSETSFDSYSSIGDLNRLNIIDRLYLYEFYKDLLSNSSCEIFVTGDLDEEMVSAKIRKRLPFKTRPLSFGNMYYSLKKVNTNLNAVDVGSYEQDVFVSIFTFDDLSKFERDYVFGVFNNIFGSGGLSSKLYRYLREDNSLCYNIKSSYNKYDSMLTIVAGIDYKNKDLCNELLLKSLKEMCDGYFGDDDLMSAKKSIINMLRTRQDSIGGIVGNYLYMKLDNMDDFDKKISVYETVSKEDVVLLANKIHQKVVYLLKGGEK